MSASTIEPEPTPVVPRRWWCFHGRWTLAVDRRLVHATGRSYLAWQNCKLRGVPYTPTLLLTTIGRRSGLLRHSVLPFHWHGEALVVIGSNSGGAVDPNWVDNLRAEPRCWVRIDRRDIAVRARITSGGERAAAFDTVLRTRPYALEYEDRTRQLGREMPVVLLQPLVDEVEP